MKLSDTMQKGLNEQIAREFTAHFLYRAIALDLYFQGYYGFSAWMENHASEEYLHAEKIIGYLKEKDAAVIIDPQKFRLDAGNWDGPRSAVEAALAHEVWLSREIHALHDLASAENDKTSILLLDWFVEEQKEEEMVVSELLKRMRVSDYSPVALTIIDSELKAELSTTAPSTSPLGSAPIA